MATSPLIVQFAQATVNPNADLPRGYEQYAGQSGIIIQRYPDDGVCLQFDTGVKLYFRADEIDEQDAQ
jgi:hypothetical protein